MSRQIRTRLAVVLLLALPLAGFIASGHVHRSVVPSMVGGAAQACGCGTTATPSRSGPDCRVPVDPDQPLCPICELAKSLHATGLPAILVVPIRTAEGSAPSAPEPRLAAAPSIHPASRSPPACTTTA